MTVRTGEPTKTESLTSVAWLWRALSILVGIIAIRFYARYPLHYLIDQTPASYGGYWFHRWWLRFHIAGASIALATGPFQLWTGFRRTHLKLHRTLGFIYLGAAVVGGIGAFGLALWSAAADHGISVFVFALAWWVTLAIGVSRDSRASDRRAPGMDGARLRAHVRIRHDSGTVGTSLLDATWCRRRADAKLARMGGPIGRGRRHSAVATCGRACAIASGMIDTHRMRANE